MPDRRVLRRALALTTAVGLAAGLALAALPVVPALAAPGAPSSRVIVKFSGAAAENEQARTGVLRRASSRARALLTETRPVAAGAHLVTVQGETAEAAAARLSSTDGVEYAVVDRFIPRSITSGALYREDQWNLDGSPGGVDIAGARPWSTGTGVRVAVVDTGRTAHPDLDAVWLGGYDFISDTFVSNDGSGRDSNPSDTGDWNAEGECAPVYEEALPSSWHGTHVAGIIAAQGQGIEGVAPGVGIVPIRVLGKCGGYESDILDGIAWASGMPVPGVKANEYPARVINVSLGGQAPCDAYARDVFAQTRKRALVVAAAGNEGADTATSWPSNCGSSVLSVAATDRSGALTGFSNRGDEVAVSAPGAEILSTINVGTTRPADPAYVDYDGTSMAAPHVAGVAALVLALDPSLTAAQLDATLRASTSPLAGASRSCCGSGIINATSAVDLVYPTVVRTAWTKNRAALGTFQSVSTLPDGATWARFSKGHITHHASSGTRVITGRIGTEYTRLGGASKVGVATSNQEAGRAGHQQQRFTKGWILDSTAGGTRLLDGPRLTYWSKLPTAEVDALGQLRGATTPDSATATQSAPFTRGAIISSSSGTFWIRGAIHGRHQALSSADRGWLGRLTSVETKGLFTGQLMNRFSGGTIYWSGPTGAWPVRSEIDKRYRAAGVAAALGNPNRMPETVKYGARKSSFAKGAIYAHSTTGAWEVHGAIGRAYDAAGGVNSRLQLPKSGEIRSGSTIYQNFRGGRITWSAGKVTIRYT